MADTIIPANPETGEDTTVLETKNKEVDKTATNQDGEQKESGTKDGFISVKEYNRQQAEARVRRKALDDTIAAQNQQIEELKTVLENMNLPEAERTMNEAKRAKEKEDEAIRKLKAYENRDCAKEQFAQRGIPEPFVDFIDFMYFDMKSLPDFLDKLENSYKQEVKARVLELTNTSEEPTSNNGGTENPDAKMPVPSNELNKYRIIK